MDGMPGDDISPLLSTSQHTTTFNMPAAVSCTEEQPTIVEMIESYLFDFSAKGAGAGGANTSNGPVGQLPSRRSHRRVDPNEQ